MHVPVDVRQGELPPMEGPARDLEIEIGVFLAVHGDNALHAGGRRFVEVIGLHDTRDIRPDSARDDARIGGAKAVGDINFLGVEIDGEIVGAGVLLAALGARAEEQQVAAGVMKIALEAADGFTANTEIRQRHAAFERGAFGVVPTPPNLARDERRLRIKSKPRN